MDGGKDDNLDMTESNGSLDGIENEKSAAEEEESIVVALSGEVAYNTRYKGTRRVKTK